VKLKNHLLTRLLNLDQYSEEHQFTDEDRRTVQIIDNRIFASKVLRVNYTTYDVRRDQDSMNPRTRCDVMVLAEKDDPNAHPYWYARVLGVFHANVLHLGPQAINRSVQRIEFLWVRWFGQEPGYRAGFREARLPMIGFLPESDPQAFGFLDPSNVIRGCHLLPVFRNGRTSALLSANATAARPIGEKDDWTNFYVNLYASSNPLQDE
jgi:hypothetical protein